ncbi:hypothetical protein [Streptomyces sp. NRRL S-1448]|uniref:hypothetical protein n=1 Tax=Streptomyces sp. NRRL S-1448 TaxID=1463883 RepID=UPI00131AF12D|nr:hypothetical protein [Streptomyces sp. NRRL S-1448]
MAPAISTAVVFLEGLTILWLLWLTPALYGNSCDNDAYHRTFRLGLKLFGCGLVISLGLLVISWFLPWQRRRRGSRVVAAILAPVSFGCLYVLFNVLLTLS